MLSTSELNELRSLMARMEAGGYGAAEETAACEHLNAAPTEPIVDKFSRVLVDGFHALDRGKVKVHHSAKKAYYHAFMIAYFAYDSVTLEAAMEALRDSGSWTEDEIEYKLFFNSGWFNKCVRRCVLPAHKLYWRVRAVFAHYGTKLDANDKTPLFNKAAWAKANNLLWEILQGHCSDPPGHDFYHQKLDKHGEPAFNTLGLPLLECSRGTNMTECVHKHIMAAFGAWPAGVEYSDALLRWFRHNHNQGVSERRRLGFPKLGHNWTEKVDVIKNLVWENHGVEVYPGWSCGTDWEHTSETFGTLPLQSEVLGDAVNAISDAKLKGMALTRGQIYLAESMGVKVPFLPVHGKEEHMRFMRMINQNNGAPNFDIMAFQW